MLKWLLAALAAPATIDAFVRLVLSVIARRWSPARAAPARPARWLVVIPSCAEGAALEPTLRSIVEAGGGPAVRSLVLLDGPDPVAADVAARLGVPALEKRSPGPTKGAALAWLVREHGELLDAVDAVLVVDVGSMLAPDFFASMALPERFDAVQAHLVGRGHGVGAAAALSERYAQEREDRGREVLGWNVRLRGTGTVFSPAALRFLAPRLRTRIEDLEASVLLTEAGLRATLGAIAASVVDDKPRRIQEAARQRARWLLGRIGLIVRRLPNLLRLIARRPLEGAALLVEGLSRPLSLTIVVRLACIATLLVDGRGLPEVAGRALLIAALVASLVLDAALVGLFRASGWRAAVAMLFSWLLAMTLLPVSLFTWTRAGRRTDPR